MLLQIKLVKYIYCYQSLLDEYGIPHYQCFIALNKLIPPAKLMDINNFNNISDYFNYRNEYSIITHKNKYIELGVQSKVKYHILIFSIL